MAGDYRRYLKYLDGLDLTYDQKIELIETMIGFIESLLRDKYAAKHNAKCQHNDNTDKNGGDLL